MNGQPEGQGKGIQRREGNCKRESKVDNRDRSVLRMIRSVRKAIPWVPAIQEGWMSQLVGGLAKSGQPHNLMSIPTLILESTITAGILMVILKVSTVTPLTQRSVGSTALFQDVHQR